MPTNKYRLAYTMPRLQRLRQSQVDDLLTLDTWRSLEFEPLQFHFVPRLEVEDSSGATHSLVFDVVKTRIHQGSVRKIHFLRLAIHFSTHKTVHYSQHFPARIVQASDHLQPYKFYCKLRFRSCRRQPQLRRLRQLGNLPTTQNQKHPLSRKGNHFFHSFQPYASVKNSLFVDQ